MTRPRLYVNVDHVATIREARRTDEPDPVEAARLAEEAGADGITVHLREDRRHIQDSDVKRLADSVKTVLNLELATSPDIIELATRLAPYQATIVPERREEVTTEGGLNLHAGGYRLRDTITRLSEAGCRVSLFVDPDAQSVDAAAELGVPAIELHTGRFAHNWRKDGRALEELKDATERALSLGLAVHAGHGLTRANVGQVAAIPGIEELNIGHHIVSRGVMIGFAGAVHEMIEAIGDSTHSVRVND